MRTTVVVPLSTMGELERVAQERFDKARATGVVDDPPTVVIAFKARLVRMVDAGTFKVGEAPLARAEVELSPEPGILLEVLDDK